MKLKKNTKKKLKSIMFKLSNLWSKSWDVDKLIERGPKQMMKHSSQLIQYQRIKLKKNN